MPMFAVPLATIATLASAGVAGTELGLNLSGAGQPSQGDAMKQLQTQNQQQQQELAQQKEQAFKHFAPDAQAATGGALSDQSFSALVAELSGQPGDVNLAQQTIFGTPKSSGSGLAAGGG